MKSLSQIAKELNVSSAVVSYVYNNKWRKNHISEKLAHKIQTKIQEENVFPDTLGMQLKTGKTQTIGVILADLERNYNLSILAGIEKRLVSTNNLVLLGNSRRGDKEQYFLNVMINRKVDGLIVCPICSEKNVANSFTELHKNMPLVFIDNYYPNIEIPFITSDNRWGAYEVTKHCIEAGREKIVYCGCGGRNFVSTERFAGYRKAIEEFGLPISQPLECSFEDKDESQDFWHKEFRKCDAVFTESFTYFDWALKIMLDKGIKVPDDIMLIGFDEPSALAALISTEAIPHARQETELMGEKTAELLLQRIDGKKMPETQIFIKPALSWEVKSNQ
jgi:LacI family transcriptional regulator, galactose operon repressor